MKSRTVLFRFLLVSAFVAAAFGCEKRQKKHEEQELKVATLTSAVRDYRLVLDVGASRVTVSGYAAQTGLWEAQVAIVSAGFVQVDASHRLNWEGNLREARSSVSAVTNALQKVLSPTISLQWRLAGSVENFIFPPEFPGQVTSFALTRPIWVMVYGQQSKQTMILHVTASPQGIRIRANDKINLTMPDLGMRGLMQAVEKFGGGRSSPLLSLDFDLRFVSAPHG